MWSILHSSLFHYSFKHGDIYQQTNSKKLEIQLNNVLKTHPNLQAEYDYDKIALQ